MALTIVLPGIPSSIFTYTRSCEKGPGNGTILANGKGISEFHSEWKKRASSGDFPQFPKSF